MSGRSAAQLALAGVLIMAVAAAISAALSPGPTHRAMPSAEVSLAIISGAALGIERLLETCWSVVDLTAGSFWPLNVVSKQINERVTGFDNFVEPYYKGLRNAAETL